MRYTITTDIDALCGYAVMFTILAGIAGVLASICMLAGASQTGAVLILTSVVFLIPAVGIALLDVCVGILVFWLSRRTP